MKAIKITAANAEAIEAALAEINGRANAHTYNSFDEIAEMAAAAEAALLDLVCKKDAAGAEWREVSGGKVSNSYKQMRNATGVTLIRKAAGWYLLSVRRTSIGKEGGGKGRLTLTQKKAELAVARFRQGFSVSKVAA